MRARESLRRQLQQAGTKSFPLRAATTIGPPRREIVEQWKESESANGKQLSALVRILRKKKEGNAMIEKGKTKPGE